MAVPRSAWVVLLTSCLVVACERVGTGGGDEQNLSSPAILPHHQQVVRSILHKAAQDVNGQELEKTLLRFVGEDIVLVLAAACELKRLGRDGLDILVRLLDTRDKVPLKNHASFSYPPHSRHTPRCDAQWIEYELDILMARAGWCIEEMTLRNFGFQVHADVRGGQDGIVSTIGSFEYYEHCAQKVRVWWSEARANWSRFQALADALRTEGASAEWAISRLQNHKEEELKTEQRLDKDFYRVLFPLIVEKLKDRKLETAQRARNFLGSIYFESLHKLDINAPRFVIENMHEVYIQRFPPEREYEEWYRFWSSIRDELATKAWR